ncbi:MAG TPA: outer membrane beta-barrel protein [Vicinamibacterales bacterium]|nr:outer membrane beta-barrel protein [Vicinamibacterales bacterium]
MRRAAPAAAFILLLVASAAAAQAPAAAPASGSWQIDGGIIWSGGVDLGTRAAELTRNPDVGGDPLQLFSTENRIGSLAGVGARVGVYVAPRVSIEGGLQFSRPEVRTRVTDDFEGATDLTATERLTQYLIDASAVYHFGSGRTRPYALGGAGYLRQLHSGDHIVEDGPEFHAGGGVQYWFAGVRNRLGVRFEARVSFQRGGFDFGENKMRTIPQASAGLAYMF